MAFYQDEVNRLLSTASNGRVSIREFRNVLPKLAQQIRQDANSPFLKLWGLSQNYDENAHAQITDRKLLTTIGRLAGHRIRDGKGYHAGLMHTYGYMLSCLQTPYGFKHERWTSGAIERATGIGKKVFWSDEGTLFQNVTYFLTRFLKIHVTEVTAGVAISLCDFDYDGLGSNTITEHLTVNRESVVIKTKLIPMPNASSKQFLIYSIQSNEVERIVTCFLVTRQYASELLAQPTGRGQEVRLRFNAFFLNAPKAGVGTRRITTS